MKSNKFSIVVFALLCVSINLFAQDKSVADIKTILESRNYVFKARTVYPQSGRMRQLTPDYDVTFTRDDITAYLPYFGKAYSAPINITEGGIKFTSTKFDYKSEKTSKYWEITIKPKDAPDIQQLYLTVFDNGNANLRVTLTSRQPISFDGDIIEGKTEKKAF